MRKIRYIVFSMMALLVLSGCSKTKGEAHNDLDKEAVKEGQTKEQENDEEEGLVFQITPIYDEGVEWSDITTITAMEIKVLDEKDTVIQNISYKYDLSNRPFSFQERVFLLDVNFDGHEDILLDLGSYGNQGIKYYGCYLWDMENNQFTESPEFQEIQNPSLNESNKQILSSWRNSAASYGYAKYIWINGIPELSAELTINYDVDGKDEFIEKEGKNGTMIETNRDKEAILNDWELESKLWTGELYGEVLHEK